MSRGGARQGAGRPSPFATPTVRRSLSLPQEAWDHLEALSIVLGLSTAEAACFAFVVAADEVGVRRKVDGREVEQ